MAGRIKGITVEINGDTTKLSKALQSVDKNIKNTQTQLKDVEKLLKLDPTNTELLAQKQKLLGQAVQDTKTRLDALKNASEQAAKTKDNYDSWKAKYDPIKQKITETEAKLKDLKEQAKTADEQLANGEISQEKYDALQREIKETTDELSGLKQQAKDVSDEFGNPISPEQYDSLQREIVETEQELQNLQTEAEKSHTALVKLGEAGASLEKAGDKIATVGTNLTKYVTVPILGVGTAAVKTTADFDASMSKVAAVSGATGEDFDALRAKAREMGSQTKFSASEAADAMNYMAMAGWKTEDMLNGVEGIMNLAAASGEDLATTSDIVTDALTALGMTAGDSAHFADILAAASSNANTNVALMGESFKYVAPVAGAMGASAEDLSIALGLMANSGIKGSQAGNSLKNALVNLTKPTKQQAAAMQQLGFISTETIQKIDFTKVEKAEQAVEDATISLDSAQIKLNDAISKYGEGSSQAQLASNNYEKAQLKLARAQETLAKEQEGVSKEIMGANTLMTDADGNMRSLGDIMGILREKMGKVNVELTDAEGNARDFDDIVAELSTTTEGLAQAEQMQAAAAIFGKQNMSGMLAIINASEEDYNKLTDAIYGCEGSAKGMAETMQDNLAGQITILKSQLQELAISFGDILMPAIRAIVSKIQAFVDKLNAMDPAVKETIVKVALVAAALGPLLVVIGKTMIGVGKLMQLISNLPTIIAGAKSAFAAFSGAIGGISAPVVAVIAVIAALVAAFVHLWKTNEDFRNKITAIWEQIKSIFPASVRALLTVSTHSASTSKTLARSSRRYGTDYVNSLHLCLRACSSRLLISSSS
ncbi:phage tail tape measure protein [Ruminococcus sp. XPD3002]|uniref:phage tail tape measure protein n=1 Tax=Ruminococcus sp. XPD3002 TaxID=1452269 RepID=UPI00091FA09E|nr:phage tail tape measure protein, TP901 family, core region [Ruminococcus flavefaciens]